MNWLFRFFDRRTDKQYTAELQSMLAILAGMNKGELAELVVFATFVRKGMQEVGNDVMCPFKLLVSKPDMPDTLIRAVVQYKKAGNTVAASAFMVWAHTMRATIRPTLMPLARQMWRELSRGFDYVEDAAIDLGRRTGTTFDITGANTFPNGFDPRF